jgi:hypothetical protein
MQSASSETLPGSLFCAAKNRRGASAGRDAVSLNINCLVVAGWGGSVECIKDILLSVLFNDVVNC